ncbi:hypothetical protein JZO86_15960 [Enterococcus ureasiticus]|uniref:hypothetical protein n=1 Tax=Enterococcus ureasiticus TaxID=903984 RepID=UPI001A8FC89D|nr:hypothetical protein [Enterococcus ureasiticus]MBO0475180.1 hypothetical protein [Enterococcus ureasiticus]
MSNINVIKEKVVKAVKEQTERDVPNEVKKRTAVATINRYLNENKDVTLAVQEIDDLVEEVVSDVVE